MFIVSFNRLICIQLPSLCVIVSCLHMYSMSFNPHFCHRQHLSHCPLLSLQQCTSRVCVSVCTHCAVRVNVGDYRRLPNHFDNVYDKAITFTSKNIMCSTVHVQIIYTYVYMCMCGMQQLICSLVDTKTVSVYIPVLHTAM